MSKRSSKTTSANYPKGIFLIADESYPQIVNGINFTPDPERNDYDEKFVQKLEKLKPLSSVKFPGEEDYDVYLKQGIHHSGGYIYRLK